MVPMRKRVAVPTTHTDKTEMTGADLRSSGEAVVDCPHRPGGESTDAQVQSGKVAHSLGRGV